MKKKNSVKENSRPPVVAVLGHVDHGKTTLLDYIRKTNVAKKEAGGITQGIGASVVKNKEGKRITFIDTPGHAAFTKMRSRGTSVADIAILVVAGEEGVKPQTKEALNFILEANIPYIVAITKIDLPTANMDSVRVQLEKLGVAFEGRGGNVPLVGVSGRSGKGIEALLDLIVLTSEVYGLEGTKEDTLEAIVIETGKDKRGPNVSVVVKKGKIDVGDEIVAENDKVKIRGIFDDTGKPIKSVFPGEPALLLGFNELPPVGSRIWVGKEQESLVSKMQQTSVKRDDEGDLSIVLKAKSAGSIEAIVANIPSEVKVITSGVGDITESDVFLAKSTDSFIFAFEVKVPASVKKLAETEDVKIESFDIVYELFERLAEIIKSESVEVKGKAEIIATFPYNDKNVAGCKIIFGEIAKSDTLILNRNEEELGQLKISSMKKGKQDVEKVKQGEECGIILTPQLDFKLSDMLISVRK